MNTMYAFCDEKVLEIMGAPGMVNSLGSCPHRESWIIPVMGDRCHG